MKKNMYFITAALALFLISPVIKGQNIPSLFFGVNAWMPDSVGVTKYNGKLESNWQKVKESNVKIVRYGGTAGNSRVPSNTQYLKIIDSIVARGFTPAIQVPFKPTGSPQYDSSEARRVVKFINTTSGRNVQYWIIGNEPDLAYGYTDAKRIAKYIKEYAIAMKTQDPNIKIIGPELAYITNSGAKWQLIDTLTRPGATSSIVGLIPSGYGSATNKGYIDYFGWHIYNYNGSEGAASVGMNRRQLVDRLVKDSTVWGYLKRRLDSCNSVISGRSTYPLKPVITEANICWNDSSSKSNDDTQVRVKASGFFAGQHWAEMMSYGLATGMEWINFWSVMEGNGTGYLTNSITPSVKSTYQHFQKIAEIMKGTYYIGKDDSSATADCKYLKSFGCKNGCYIAVFVMNQDSGGANKLYSVNLNDSFKYVTNYPYSLKFNMGKPTTYLDTIEPQSTTLLMFNCGGGVSKKYRFKMTDSIGDSWIPYAAKLNPDEIYTVSAGADQTLCCAGCGKTYTATISPNATGCTYQWYKNGVLQSGATGQTYTCFGSGSASTYTVKVVITKTSTGCTSEDEALMFFPKTGPNCGIVSGVDEVQEDPENSFIQALVPNPAQSKVTVFYSLLKDSRNVKLTLMNYNGQIVSEYKLNENATSYEIDCVSFASGIYFTVLQVDGKQVSTKKLIISK